MSSQESDSQSHRCSTAIRFGISGAQRVDPRHEEIDPRYFADFPRSTPAMAPGREDPAADAVAAAFGQARHIGSNCDERN